VFTELATTWLVGLGSVILSALGCTVVEVVAAVEKQSWLSRVRALLFWAVFLAAVAAVTVPAQWLIRYSGIEPSLSLDFRFAATGPNWWWVAAAYVLLPFAPYLLFDCFYYWFHRMQHAVPLLWRFHAVHHSIEELNAANCYHHATEGLFRLPFIFIPLMLVIDLKVPDVVVITAVLSAWGHFVHANTRVSFGPLDRILATPRWHRVHHSLASEHRDKRRSSQS
jgi:sterol desaturase/sphingolipid hydroxylase (fatty acid hydroxylase superfamily)